MITEAERRLILEIVERFIVRFDSLIDSMDRMVAEMEKANAMEEGDEE